MLSPDGDRGFESISLQQRVSCEPDFLVGIVTVDERHPGQTAFERGLATPTPGSPRCSLRDVANGPVFPRWGGGTASTPGRERGASAASFVAHRPFSRPQPHVGARERPDFSATSLRVYC